MQEAVKCMRHSKRTVLTSMDVDNALKLRNLEVSYRIVGRDAVFSFSICVHINMVSFLEFDLDIFPDFYLLILCLRNLILDVLVN